MEYLLFLSIAPVLYWAIKMTYMYIVDGADRRTATSLPLFLTAVPVLILQVWGLNKGPNLYIELLTAYMLYIIPQVLVKNTILFNKNQYFKKNTRCVLFLISALCFTFFMFRLLDYDLNPGSTNSGISFIVSNSVANQDIFYFTNFATLIMCIFLLILSINVGRKKKTIVIFSIYTFSIALLTSAMFISYSEQQYYAIYLLVLISSLLVLWRKWDDIMKDAKKVSVIYADVIRSIKKLRKANLESKSLVINTLIDIFNQNDKLKEAVLLSKSLNRQDNITKKYIRNKMGIAEV